MSEDKRSSKPLLPPKPVLPPGATLIHDFVDKKEAAALLEFVNKCEWDSSMSRRVQHYGYTYYYSGQMRPTKTNPVPDEFKKLINRMILAKDLFTEAPDQIIVNEYEPGQGIAPHTDHKIYFRDTIATLSLGHQYNMELTHDKLPAISVPLPIGSLLVLTGDARHKWKHSIAARKTDINVMGKRVPRGTRVSITFRKVAG